jgi:uncharacterized membrane protein (UPF0182 family)
MWGRYHISDAGEFYEQSDGWSVAQDPGATVGVQETTATTNAAGVLGPARTRRIEPYYLLMRVPGDADESFVMFRPFVPFSEDDRRNELSAFMTANSDPDQYGRLQTFVMPRGRLPDGPAIVAANIASNEQIAREVSLLDQRGSEVRLGNLLLIPIEDSLLYVRPLYVQAAGQTAVPELRNVIVAFGGQVVMRNTLQESLAAIFGAAPPTLEAPVTGERPDQPPTEDGTTPPGTTPPTTTPPSGDESVSSLLAQAQEAFTSAEAALRAGDLARYQSEIARAQALVQRALTLAPPVAGGGAPPPSTTPPSTAPPTGTA